MDRPPPLRPLLHRQYDPRDRFHTSASYHHIPFSPHRGTWKRQVCPWSLIHRLEAVRTACATPAQEYDPTTSSADRLDGRRRRGQQDTTSVGRGGGRGNEGGRDSAEVTHPEGRQHFGLARGWRGAAVENGAPDESPLPAPSLWDHASGVGIDTVLLNDRFDFEIHLFATCGSAIRQSAGYVEFFFLPS